MQFAIHLYLWFEWLLPSIEWILLSRCGARLLLSRGGWWLPFFFMWCLVGLLHFSGSSLVVVGTQSSCIMGIVVPLELR